MLDDRHVEHLACAGAVDVAPLTEHIEPPLFSRHPCDDAGFNGAEVSDDEFATLVGDKGCADQFRKHIRDRIVQHLQRTIIARAHELPGLLQIPHVVLRQVLELNEATTEATGTIGSVEHEHAVGASILAHAVLHRLILLHRAFRQLLA